MVLIAPSGGDTPLRQQQDEARNTLFKQAREHPLVQSVFEVFPSAEIHSVNDFGTDFETNFETEIDDNDTSTPPNDD